jgi:hypothetical protein
VGQDTRLAFTIHLGGCDTAARSTFSTVLGGESPLGQSPVSQHSERDADVHEMTCLGCLSRSYQGGCFLAEQLRPSAEATGGPLGQG